MKNRKKCKCQLFSILIVVVLWLGNSNISLGLDVASSDSLTFPVRGAFYYSWYPQTWTVDGAHVKYDVELGYYSSDDPDVVDQHIEDMDYAKIDVAIASWWGVNKQNEANRFPMLLDQTSDAGSSLKWAVYYEQEGFGNPTVEELKSDLDYLMETYAGHDAFARIDGKPVVFVYNADDKDCEVADRWAEASNGEWYVNLKVFGGYRNCANQPDSWHQYGPASYTQRHNGNSFVISPGFWRADEAEARLERDVNQWNKDVRAMVASKEPWQLITTFNEWGEGTAIERCFDWDSETGFGLYLDALHYDGNPESSVADDASKKGPSEFVLAQNYPNPFNPTTTIQFTIPVAGQVTLTIYNSQGQKVEALVDDFKVAGEHQVTWSAIDVPSGVYLYQLTASDFVQTKKLIKLK